jgi:dihydropteroate synthase
MSDERRPGDGAVVATAVAVSIAAWSVPAVGSPAWGPTVVAGLVVTALGRWRRRAAVVGCGLALLAAGASARAWLDARPATPGPLVAPATLVGDPERFGSQVTVVVRVEGRRLVAAAAGSSGRVLERLSAGQVAVLHGTVRPLTGASARRLAAEHVVGRWEVDVVADTDAGGPLARAANRVRGAVADGARTLPPDERALFLGLILGDVRGQSDDVVDEFRASGLSHLTAVSGQNVAFVVAAASPLLRRLGRNPRVLAVLGLLVFFAVLTRLEPSVLRATAMAGVATVLVALDRPQASARVLAFAVILCTLVDPFLVHRVGWWLSVGATTGIVVLGRRLASRLPGPRALADVLGITAAAQVGVAPVQVAVFDGLAVASIPANLLAAPAAAPVMGYGVPAALLAAVLPDGVAAAVVVPIRLAVRWLLLLARLGAAAPLGALVGAAAAVAVTGLVIVAFARGRVGRRMGFALVAAAVVAAIVAPRTSEPVSAGVAPVGSGVMQELWLGSHRFDITDRALVMGILNRTPDSFYDQGRYWDFDAFLRKAEQLVAEGADFLDVGGVKAGPGVEVTEAEELDRVIPAVAALRSRFDLPLSVDTWRASVLDEACRVGASVGNDISGFGDPDYLDVAARHGASVVATHIRLGPRIPDPDPVYPRGVVTEVVEFLRDRATRAVAAGIPPVRVMVDAGLDLGKTEPQSLALLRASDALVDLGFPVFLSASNKRFLGVVLGLEVDERRLATAAAHALGIVKGCRVLRAHDVRGSRRVADVVAALLAAQRT